jgi:hypothetical protein
MIRTRLITTLAAVVIAAVTAAPALAGGERKNERPFVVSPVTRQVALTGEPKNQAPFNGPVDTPTTVIVSSTHSSFSWLDAGIGAAAGVGATCAAAGVAALTRTSRRSTAAA